MLEHLDIYLDQYYCLVLIFGRIRNQDDVVHTESYFNFSDRYVQGTWNQSWTHN
jgi:hypothetical protein